MTQTYILSTDFSATTTAMSSTSSSETSPISLISSLLGFGIITRIWRKKKE